MSTLVNPPGLTRDQIDDFLRGQQDLTVSIIIFLNFLIVLHMIFLREASLTLGWWLPVLVLLTLLVASIELLRGNRGRSILWLGYVQLGLRMVSFSVRSYGPGGTGLDPYAAVLTIAFITMVFVLLTAMFDGWIHCVIMGLLGMGYIVWFARSVDHSFLRSNYVYPVMGLFFFLVATLYMKSIFQYVFSRFREIRDNLDAEVRERTEELRRSKKKIEREKRARETFFSNITHDLRNPLNSVLGYAELLLQDVDDEVNRGRIQNIRRAGRTLMRFLDHLLDISDVTAEGPEQDTRKLEVRSFLSGVREVLAGRALKKGLRLTVDVESSVPQFIRFDGLLLKQILYNLLENAIKYTKEGYVQLSVEGTYVDDSTANLRFAVEDSGPGVEPERKEEIFQDRQRAVDSYEEEEGHGLGLYHTKRQVESLGGSIEVKSEEGVGSTFIVRFEEVQVVSEEDKGGSAATETSELVPLSLDLPKSLAEELREKVGGRLETSRRSGSFTDASELVDRLRDYLEEREFEPLESFVDVFARAVEERDVSTMSACMRKLSEGLEQ